MTLALSVLWFAFAVSADWWCPVGRPRLVLRPPRGLPEPPPEPFAGPQPEPWRTPLQVFLTGLAGIAGGYLFQRAFGPGQGGLDAAYAATTCLGAFAGSTLVSGGLNAFLSDRPEAGR